MYWYGTVLLVLVILRTLSTHSDQKIQAHTVDCSGAPPSNQNVSTRHNHVYYDDKFHIYSCACTNMLLVRLFLCLQVGQSFFTSLTVRLACLGPWGPYVNSFRVFVLLCTRAVSHSPKIVIRIVTIVPF